MPAPPPPPPPAFAPPSAGQDGIGQLLQSIRAGKTLKKTVTVDKSAPAIGGKVKEDRSNSSSTPFRGGSVGVGNAGGGGGGGGGPSLGGLFSGGMPKLRATGLRSNAVERDSSEVTPSIKRGPPPVPPPATQKPPMIAEGGSAEPAATAVASAPTFSKGFGKPTLAPKPPPPPPLGVAGTQKPSPPPKKLSLLGGPSVSRAQSMRLPRSPPVLAPVAPSSLHQSQDCLNETMMQQHQHQHHHQQQQHRPIINRALRPPIARPPSPPTSKVSSLREAAHQIVPQTTTTTRVAPPPPSRLPVTAPSMPPPPPPPPYRSTSMHQRLAPPPPPTPPTRVASAAGITNANASSPVARNGAMIVDLEVKFADKFHSIMNFPDPSPFRGFPKVYNSKNAAKQQAPAPPLQPSSAPGTMIRSNPSSGGKQWQRDAASSAC